MPGDGGRRRGVGWSCYSTRDQWETWMEDSRLAVLAAHLAADAKPRASRSWMGGLAFAVAWP